MTTTSIDDALADVRAMLESDGYTLSVERIDEGTAYLTVGATESACEECLAPKVVISEVILNAINHVPGIDSVALTYPTDGS